MLFEHLKVKDRTGRTFRVWSFDSFKTAQAPDVIWPGGYCLFVACDSDEMAVATLSQFARTAIKNGSAYVCTFGKGCSRLHDIFDEVHVIDTLDDPDDEGVLMTTWHDKSSLEDSLHFFVNCAYPNEDYAETPNDWIAISVGSEGYAREMARILRELLL